MIVLDTTVLVYAVGADHPLREPSRRLIDAVAEGRIEATTTPAVLQEFAHVRARRRGRKDAATLARDYTALLSPLLVTEIQHLRAGLKLFERHAALDAADALLAATAATADADALVSADAAFAAVPKLRHVAPGTAAFDQLLRA